MLSLVFTALKSASDFALESLRMNQRCADLEVWRHQPKRDRKTERIACIWRNIVIRGASRRETMKNESPLNSSDIDSRLAHTDLPKLADISGNTSLKSPPFYNCFVNRFVSASDVASRDEQRTDDAQQS